MVADCLQSQLYEYVWMSHSILITSFLQILNLTELELNRVDIRVGLSGALYFMDASPQAVRQLRSLVSQVTSTCLC